MGAGVSVAVGARHVASDVGSRARTEVLELVLWVLELVLWLLEFL